MKIAVGADHRGHPAMSRIADMLTREGHQVTLHGSTSGETCDYPEAAYEVGKLIAAGERELGVLICGTGIGMSIAANKLDGVRAAVVHDELTAELSRSHNDANIVCLSSDLLGERIMEKIVRTFIAKPFEGGRHARRIEKIRAIEQGHEPAPTA